MVPRVVPSLSLLPRFCVSAAALFLGVTALVGCVDHAMNAQVRSAEDFECKRGRVRVTEVKSGVFVARGCGQEGAYRCEMGIEGGCRRLLGKPADQAMELAPEGEGDSEEDTEVTTKKKKKKKPAAEEEGAGEKGDGASKKDGSEKGSGKSGSDKGSEKSGSEKSGSEKSGSEKSGSEKSGSEKSGSEKSGSEKSTSSKASADKTEGDEPKPEKKKKKKVSEDE